MTLPRDEAQAAMAARAWHRAASAWSAVALGVTGEARREAWEAAGECWRRDDRPQEARRALELALGQPQSGAHRAMALARLIGVLGELGEGALARTLGRDALAVAEGPARAVVLDTLVSTELGFGRKAAARDAAEALAEVDASGLAHAYRAAQLARLDGDLASSRTGFEALARALEAHPGTEAGLAAVWMELAELSVLEGDPAAALPPFETGRRLHLEAGRRSMAWRCEAGRVRAAAEAGLASVSPLLETGLRVAAERGLRALALDLRLARGSGRAVGGDASGAADDLRAAAAEAEALGARLRAGRALWQLLAHDLLRPGERPAARRDALERLADHVPLRARVEALPA